MKSNVEARPRRSCAAETNAKIATALASNPSAAKAKSAAPATPPPAEGTQGARAPSTKGVRSGGPNAKTPATEEPAGRSTGRKRALPETFTYHRLGETGREALSSHKRAKGPAKKAGKAARKHFQSVELDGEEFSVGSSAYVLLDPDCLDEAGDLDESEPCEVCQKTCEQDKRTMLECDICLRGFHVHCVKLKGVPKGNWLCASCAKGKPIPHREKPITARERFLHPSHQVGMVYISSIWKEPAPASPAPNAPVQDDFKMDVRWYLRPEDTHVGRQKFHNAREVFLSRCSRDVLSCSTLIRPTTVCHEEEFRRRQHDGDDVFLCTSAYDEEFRRFVPRRPDGLGEDEDVLGGGQSESEDEGEAFDVRKAAREERGRRKPTKYQEAQHALQEKRERLKQALIAESHPVILGPIADACVIPTDIEEDARLEYEQRRGRVQGGLEFLVYKRRVQGVRPLYMIELEEDKGKKAAGGEEEQAEDGGSESESESEEEEEGRGGRSDEAGPSGSPAFYSPGGTRSNQRPAGALSLRKKQSLMAKARASLLLCNVPSSLPCREAEKNQVLDFVKEFVCGGGEGAYLYISGVPGTGKTATVHQVMREMRRLAVQREVPGFQFIEINALNLTSPQQAYSKLWEALTSERTSPAAASKHLDKRFSGKPGPHAPVLQTVLLLDEMDLLVNRKQSVLYSLLEWPQRKGSKLAVIGIANTMDLPERLLPKITSRMGGLKRLQFQPYRHDQMRKIVESRLESALGPQHSQLVFQPQALDLATKKVGAVSGDLRRVLELGKRALEIAEEGWRRHQEELAQGAGDQAFGSPKAPSPAKAMSQQQYLVTINNVNRAQMEMFGAVHRQWIDGLSRGSAIALAALCQEIKYSGCQEVTAEAVHDRMCDLYLLHKELGGEPLFLSVVQCFERMGDSKLLVCEDPSRGRLMKLGLNVPQADVELLLSRREDIEWLPKLFGQ